MSLCCILRQGTSTLVLLLLALPAIAGCFASPPPPSLWSPTAIPATATSTAAPRLIMRLDIRDGVTGQPVEAEAWYTVDVGDDHLAAAGVSAAEFDLPPGKIILKVQAQGYRLWWVQIHEWQRGERDQLLPIPVKLEPLK